MPEVRYFLICNNIESITNAEKKQTVPALIAPQLAIRPKYIPGNFSFGIALGLSGVDASKDNEAKITIKDPKGVVVFDSGISKLPKVKVKDTLPIEHQGFLLTADLRNLAVEEEGDFKLSLILNGNHIDTKSIPVYKRK